MREDLLPELETAPTIATSLESIEELVREAMSRAPQVASAVKGMKGLALTFVTTWQSIVANVAKGDTPRMHAARPQLASAVEKKLGALKDTYALARLIRELGREEIPDPDILLPEIAGLQRLKARVLDLWQTAEDLEDLAARDYPLTTADLERIVPQRRPASSWYEEESKPF